MITYMVEVTRGSPLCQDAMSELGEQGWRLVGCFCRSGYPDETYWYYFIREEEA